MVEHKEPYGPEGKDVRGGGDCKEHQWIDGDICGVCHERKKMGDSVFPCQFCRGSGWFTEFDADGKAHVTKDEPCSDCGGTGIEGMGQHKMASYVAKGQDWKVLDHGYIRLIDWMGTDETIIEAARMSTGKGFQAWEPHQRCKKCGTIQTPEGVAYTALLPCKHGEHEIERQPGDLSLLDYLWRMGHHTPFEMNEIHIEVYAPILVFRQWHRHRTMSYNEASARYAKMSEDHYLPTPERIQAQDKKNKQGSSGNLDDDFKEDWLDTMKAEQGSVYQEYLRAVDCGVANETARLNTPVSRYSKMRVKTDLRNWLGFLKLRMHPHAQWEIRQYANVVGNEIIAKLFPRTWGIFQEHTLEGVNFSRTELKVVQELLTYMEKHAACADLLQGTAEKHGLKGSLLKEFLAKVQSAGQK
jgi:thymidylate synthase (FAD)